MVGTYRAAQKILVDMLIQLGADPGHLQIAQDAIRVATLISIRAGSASPTQVSSLKRFLMQKQVANSRAKKASKKLSQSCVDQVIIGFSRINRLQGERDAKRLARGLLVY